MPRIKEQSAMFPDLKIEGHVKESLVEIGGEVDTRMELLPV
jgi:hypothetical protein